MKRIPSLLTISSRTGGVSVLLGLALGCDTTLPDGASSWRVDSAVIDPRLTQDLEPGDEHAAVSFVRVVSDEGFLRIAGQHNARVSKVCLRAGGMGGSYVETDPRLPDRSMVAALREAAVGLLDRALAGTGHRIVQSGFLEMEPAALDRDSIRVQAQSFLGTARRIRAAIVGVVENEAIVCGFEAIASTTAVDRLVADSAVATVVRRVGDLQRAVQVRLETPLEPALLITEDIRALSGSELQRALLEISEYVFD